MCWIAVMVCSSVLFTEFGLHRWRAKPAPIHFFESVGIIVV